MKTHDEHVQACAAAADNFFRTLTEAQQADVSLAFILPAVLDAMRANGIALEPGDMPLIGGLLG